MILKTIEKEDIDLVIMGTSGKHGLDRFLLGSVTEKVVSIRKVLSSRSSLIKKYLRDFFRNK